MYSSINNSLILKCLLTITAALLITGCERDVSDDAVVATFSSDGTVFIDTFSSGLDYFPFGGTVQEAFSVDTQNVFEGEAAMRFDIPNVGDPAGAFAGANFADTGAGRDLTGYDALTFYAQATKAATINDIGFGLDGAGDTLRVALPNLRLSTNWRKYIIPIPDASKLTQVNGLLWYAEGPEDGDGYTFWLDEVQFEKLGTLAQYRPSIYQGQDIVQETFIGASFQVGDLATTVNTASQGDVTVAAAPAYFTFMSSNPAVATVNAAGEITVIGASPLDSNMEPIPTIITASLGVDENGDPNVASGSLSIVSLGDFEAAPTPTRDASRVISIFSDAYNNVPVDYYNGFFNGDGQTTEGGEPPLFINNNQVINYTNLNFVGIGTFLNVNPVDASSMSHMHVDINVQEDMQPGDYIDVQLLNGVQTGNETSGTVRIPASDLTTDTWEGFDIPLSSFTGLAGRDQLGLIFFVSGGTISNILVDNIYYYQDVLDPTPNVDDSAASQLALPLGFESSSLNYNFTEFAGAPTMVVSNPVPGGINTSGNVIMTEKAVGAEFFAGAFLDLDAAIDFSTTQKIRMKVYSPKAGIPVRMALEELGGGSQIVQDAVVLFENEWNEIEFDFSGVYNPAVNYQRVVIFYEFVTGLRGDGTVYYGDDIQLIN
ncbi:MAG: hypothetical protein WBA16_03715 [Nonlabens sp.]